MFPYLFLFVVAEAGRIKSLEEEKRYLLSELSLEKENHSKTLALYEQEKRKVAELNAQLADVQAELQETQVAALSKDKKIHGLTKQLKDATDAATSTSSTSSSSSATNGASPNTVALAQATQRVAQLEALLVAQQSNNAAGAANAQQLKALADENVHLSLCYTILLCM